MITRIYLIPKDRAMKISDNEQVKRHGESRQFDSSIFELAEKGTVIIVKGDSELFKLDEFDGLEELEEKQKVLDKLAEMDENAASGVGMIFG
ncbi:MAG: hypothetical protein GOU99_01950 [Candidatus Altiarchaeota archaeon]|nr:hypothetical protein [Candidatus Altiarchaeota archaeon]